MSSTLGFSELDNTSNIKQSNTLQDKIKNRNTSPQVKSMLKQLNDASDDIDDYKPQLSVKKQEKDNDTDVNVEGFNQMDENTWNENYYQQYITPNHKQSVNYIPPGNQEILDKLDYLIHSFETNEDLKKESTTEDVVLYCFLGIFMIFTVDSFVKVGKYVR